METGEGVKTESYSFSVTGKGLNSSQLWFEIDSKKDAAGLARLLLLAGAESVSVNRSEKEVP